MTPLRFALRQARRQPGFTLAVTAMLAVGIGATTAMFSMVYGLLLDELRVPEPEQLVNLGAPGTKWGDTTCTMPGDCDQIFSYPMFRDLEARARMEGNPSRDGDRTAYWIYAFGRLKPGVSLEQARASLNTLYSGIVNEVDAPLNSKMPADVLEKFRARKLTVEPGSRGQSVLPGIVGTPLAMLLGVTVVVLLIVCVNVASLMLARGARRASELAIRSSIGASRWQLVRDLLLECGVFGVLGGLASLPLGTAALRGVIAMMPGDVGGIDARGQVKLGLSPTAGAFAAALALVTVLLFGLLPAFRASRADPGAAMKGQTHNAVAGRGITGFGSALATSQVVFSMMLLVFAGLFAQSLANLARADLGMNADSVVTFTVSPRRNGYDNSQAMQFFAALEHELAAQAGVTNVASSMVPLIASSNWDSSVKIDGRELDPAASSVSRNEVSPGFFRTLSIPLLQGRDFTEADRSGSPRVAIVNEAFIRKFHIEGTAVGKRFSLDDKRSDIEIVGVVADAKYSSVRADAPPQLILPRLQNEGIAALTYYVRAAVPADLLMRTIKGVVAAADANLPVTGLHTMDEVVKTNLFTDRLVAILAGGFAALATLLAAAGLYGVLAYNVAQRTREFGLRLALGATAGGLRRMVLRQVAKIALIGIPIGLGLGVLLGQGAKALLYGLSNYDPVVLGGAVGVLAGVVLAAGYLPARRASAVDPMEALRHE